MPGVTAILAAARPDRVHALITRLAGRDCELLCTSRFNRAGFDDVRQTVLPVERFTAAAAADVHKSYAAVAIPYAHAHAERHEYRNVEEFAAALGAPRIIRLFANNQFSEEDAPTMARLAQFHDDAAAKLRLRRRERLAELAAFAGRPTAEVELACAGAEAAGITLWRAAPPRTAEEVAAFYRNHDFYLYQLTRANYYSGGRTEYLATISALLDPGLSVLEFGCGVGEVILELARLGHEAAAVDINPRLLDFVRFKAARRGLRLAAGPELPDRQFPAIIALDVLEHVVDPEMVLGGLLAHLTGPRLLLTRLPDESEDVPMHFAGTRRRIETYLRERQFTRLPAETDLDVFRGA